MAVGGVFEPLIKCLGSADRLIKFYAAQALFNLAENPKNRQILLDTGLNFLVVTATTRVSRSNVSDEEEYRDLVRLQQGAAKVLCKLAMTTGDLHNARVALQSELVQALILVLEEIISGLSAPVLVRAAGENISLLCRTLLSIAQATEASPEILALVEQQMQRWSHVLVQIGTLVGVAARRAEANEMVMPFRRSLVEALNLFLGGSLQLRTNAANSLLKIAGECWDSDGAYIVELLTKQVTDNEQWIRVLPSKSKVDFESIIQGAVSLFLRKSFKDGTSVVLDFLRAFTSLNGQIERDNQLRVLELIKDKQTVTSVSHSPLQFFFRSKNGVLQLSSTQEKESKVWRDLKMFYAHELRRPLREFMDSTLQLWAAVCAGHNVHATTYFQSLVSFKQVFSAMCWRYSDSHSRLLTNECAIIVDLAVHLYVNCDPSTFDSLYRMDRTVLLDDGMPYLEHQAKKCELDVHEQELLILYVNEFLGGGRKLSDYKDKCPVGFKPPQTMIQCIAKGYDDIELDFCRAVLGLLKHLVVYGFYDKPFDFATLKSTLKKVLTETTRAPDRPAIQAVKLQMVEILQIMLEIDLNLQVDELVELLLCAKADRSLVPDDSRAVAAFADDLIRNNRSPPDIATGSLVRRGPRWRSGNADGNQLGTVISIRREQATVIWHSSNRDMGEEKEAELPAYDINGEIEAIRFPRLHALLSAPSDSDLKFNQVLQQLSGSTLPDLAQGAMNLLVRGRDAVSLFYEHLPSLVVITPAEVPYVNFVTQAIAHLRRVKLDENLTTSARIELEKTLELLHTAIEGRTFGVSPKEGLRVRRGPDWQYGDDDSAGVKGDPYGEVTAVVDADSGQRVVVRWRHGGFGTYNFGAHGSYEVKLVHEGPHIFVQQTLARILGLHSVLVGLIEQEKLNTTYEFTGIYISCYSLLQAFCAENRDNKIVLCTPTFLNLLTLHLNGNFGAKDTWKALSTAPDFYKFASHQFIDAIIRLLNDKVDHNEHDEAAEFVHLLSDIIPDSSTPLSDADRDQLRQTQLLLLRNVITRMSTVKQVLNSPNLSAGLLTPSSPLILALVDLFSKVATSLLP